MRLKIHILTGFSFPEVNGVSISIYERCKILASNHNLTLLRPEYDSIDNHELELISLGVKVISLPSESTEVVNTGIQLSSNASDVVYEILNKESPDILMVEDPLVLSYQAKFSLDRNRLNDEIRTLAMCHGDFRTFLWKWGKFFDSLKLRMSSTDIYNNYDFTLFSTKFIMSKFECVENKELLPFLGVDRDRFKYIKRKNRDGLKILYVGRLTKDKNIAFIIKSAIKLNKIYPDITWHFVGDGPLKDEIEKKNLDYVTCHGYLEGKELINQYQSADIYVNSCDYESFGLSIIEAMATGLPVLVPDKGGSSEHFSNNYSGLKYKTGSVKSFISKISLLRDDFKLRDKMGQRASIGVNDWKSVISNLEVFITKISNTNSELLENIKDKDLLIQTLSSEYREVAKEIADYTKHIIQLKSVFLVFFGTAFGFILDGNEQIAPLLQILIFPFIFLILQLDQNVMGNSNYLIYLEKRINLLFGNDVIGWQRCIAYYNIQSFRQKGGYLFYMGPLMFTTINIVIYSFTVYYTFLLISKSNVELAIGYSIISILVFLLFMSTLNKMKKAFGKNGIKFLNEQIMKFRNGIKK